MGKLIFILGGARSGKSTFALELAKKSGKKKVFIATALPSDSEMKQRIKEHKKNRPRDWETIEITKGLDKKIERQKNGTILIDCLTIYVSHLINLKEPEILNHIKKTIEAIKKSGAEFIVVSNEVGAGIHPNNKLGRDFRDVLGSVNQMFVYASDEFYVMFAGIPVDIKKWKRSTK